MDVDLKAVFFPMAKNAFARLGHSCCSLRSIFFHPVLQRAAIMAPKKGSKKLPHQIVTPEALQKAKELLADQSEIKTTTIIYEVSWSPS